MRSFTRHLVPFVLLWAALGGGSVSVLAQAIQTISFEQPLPKLPSASPFSLTATASSGQPVSFEVVTGPATVSGATLTLTGAPGGVTVKATQAGDGSFLPAPEVYRSFVVAHGFQGFTKVARGSSASHTVAIRSDGTLWTWGNNSNGQLGDASTTHRYIPAQVGTVTSWTDVAAGSGHSLALRADGSLWAWGLNGNGQLGDGSTTQRAVPTQVGGGSTWTAISAGSSHSAAVRSDGTLWVWGSNGNGQLGDGTTTQSTIIKQVGTAANWRSVSCGNSFTLAVNTSNELWAWGNNSNGQLGLGNTTQRLSPVMVGTNWSVVSAGSNSHSAGLRTDGRLFAWGLNSSGQLGDGTTTQRTSPVQIGTGTTWASVVCGNSFTAGRRTDGSVWAWGANQQGQLADGTRTNRSSPTQVGTALDWSAVTVGTTGMLLLRSDGSIWAAGDSTSGPLGTLPNNWTLATSLPAPVSQLTSSHQTVHYLRPDGTVWGWGTGSAVGDGTTVERFSPVQVGTASDWSAISSGINLFTMGIKNGGELWGWGFNGNGQLGLNDTSTRTAPTRVGTDSNWQKVSAGSLHVLAVKNGGELWAWGLNSNAQVGDGTTTQRNAPVRIGTDTDWAEVFAAANSSFAIKTDGSLWAWGSNSDGRLGDGTSTQRSTPVRIGTDNDWLKLAGYNHVLAIKTDGSLWSWGWNGYGQLGSGNTTSRSLPVRVGTGTDWSEVSAGQAQSLAIKADGTLWVCGQGIYGPTGINATSNTLSFTQVGTDSRWQHVQTVYSHSLAVRSDQTLWGAGPNLTGRLLGAGRDPTVIAPVLPLILSQTVSVPAAVSIHGPAALITASSGLIPRVDLISGPATVSGNAITATGTGVIEVSVSQDGDDAAWNSVVPTVFTLTVNNSLTLGFSSAGAVGHVEDGFNASTSNLTPTLHYAPVAGDVLTVVNNTGASAITGTFPGQPQGAYLVMSYGGTAYTFQISYTGGDGNDITLTALEPAEIALEQPAGTPRTDGASVGFGTTVLGTTVTRSLTVKNTGTGTLTITGITIDGAAAADYLVSSPGSSSVVAGSSTTFDVTFNPAAAGARTATLHVLSSDADEASYEIVLVGTCSGLSTPVNLVKDINAVGNIGYSSGGAMFNGVFYMQRSSFEAGGELWRTDGTLDGTYLVRDINSGTSSSSPANFAALGPWLYFAASDSTSNGTELWRTDGTSAGTTMVLNINTASNTGSSPANLTPAGSVVFFTASDSTSNGTELWSTDGTAAGTVLVQNINPTANSSSSPANLNYFNGILIFTANNGTSGTELWKSDGTNAGTALLKDINSGSSSSSPSNFIVVGSTLYFTATDSTNGTELWKTDGTAAGTVLVKDINAGTSSSSPGFLRNLNATLVFRATTSAQGSELWTSDGTSAGTVLVKDINSGTSGSNPSNMALVGNKVYFAASTSAEGTELWVSDGTDSGTAMVKDIWPGSTSSAPSSMLGLGNKLLFYANDGTNGAELWLSDGTDTGTGLLKDIQAGTGNSSISNMSQISNGAVVFAATDGINGQELWRTDGTGNGTFMLRDTFVGTGGSSVANLRLLNGSLLFTANDGALSTELWMSDGTAAGTQLLKDIFSGGSASNPSGLVLMEGKYFFAAADSAGGTELWSTDGTLAGTTQVKDINTGTGSSSPGNLTVMGSTLYFSASTTAAGIELWKSDGTNSGTVQVADINSGTANSSPSNFRAVGSTLYFAATTAAGSELWKSDGTSGGTVQVADINAGTGSSSPSNMVDLGGVLIFSANDGINGSELWKSDGTTAGTVMLKDIHTTAGTGSSISNMTVMGTSVYFAANSAANSTELWTSDGTAEGTMMVKDIHPTGSGGASSLTAIGSTLWFSADNGVTGGELWKSDGTEAGTVLIKDIRLGSSGATPTAFFESAGLVYFRAFTDLYGSELWVTDGTSIGTRLVADVLPGPNSSSPANFITLGSKLYFTANGADLGTELWSLDPGTQPEIALFEGVGTAGTERQDNTGTYDFGSQSASTTRSFTLKNNGTGNLYITDITLSGPQQSSFFVLGKPDPSLPIVPGATATFTVTATLAGPIVQDATVEIACNDANEAIFEMAVHAETADTMPPVISAPANYFVGQSGALSLPLPDVRHIVVFTDNIPGVGTITQTPVPGSTTLSIGQTQVVSFTATDSSGNTSNTVTTAVTMGVGQPATGNLAWAQSGGGIGNDANYNNAYECARIAALPDGGMVVAGMFTSSPFTLGSGQDAVSLNSAGFLDVFLAKYRADGSLEWAKSIGGTNNDTLRSLIVLGDGSIVLGGIFTGNMTIGMDVLASPGGVNNDGYIVKYLPDGTQAWAKSVGGTNTDGFSQLTELSDGNIGFAGGSFSGTYSLSGGVSAANTGSSGSDVFIGKINSATGDGMWVQGYGSVSGNEVFDGIMVRGTPDGGLAVVAPWQVAALSFSNSALTLTKANTNQEWLMLKYDAAGALVWAKSAGGVNGDTPYNMAVLADGDVVAYGLVNGSVTFGAGEAGVSTSAGFGSNDGVLARFSGVDGTMKWVKRFGGTGGESIPSFAALGVLPDGSLAITGSFSNSLGRFGVGEPGETSLTAPSTAGELYVARMNVSNGNLIWAKSAGGLFTETATALLVLDRGDIAVSGHFSSATVTFGAGEAGQTVLTNANGAPNVSNDLFLARFDFDDGSLLGVKRAGGVNAEVIHSAAVLKSGSTVLAGNFQPATAVFGAGEAGATTLTNVDTVGTNTDLFVARFDTGGVQPPSAPLITLLPVTDLSSSSFTYHAEIDPQGMPTTVLIDYGPTDSYGSTFTAAVIPAGFLPVIRSLTLTGLGSTDTTYVRVRATNTLGTTTGGEVFVTTYSNAEISVEQPTGSPLTDGASTVDFGIVTPGNSAVRTFTVRNLGAGTLSGLAMTLSGAAAGDYEASAPGATSLAPGESTSFTVTYTPTLSGVRSATLRIASNDGDENPFDVLLTGTNLLTVNVASAGSAGLTLNGYNVPAGRSLNVSLGFTPAPGSTLMVISNTSANAINGTFTGLPQGGTISATFGGQTYVFHANYAGGDGNDLVLTEGYGWTWIHGSQAGNQNGIYSAHGVATPTNVPGARSGSATWQDAEGNLWLFGGLGLAQVGNTAGYLSELWKWNRANNQWTWVKGDGNNGNGTYGTLGVAATANNPGARHQAASWLGTDGSLWLFGGFGWAATGTTTSYLNDLWKYDPVSNNWTWMAGSNTHNTNGSYGTQGQESTINLPGARFGAVTWIDAATGHAWLFGGSGLGASGTTVSNLNDLWRFNPTSGAWVWMKGNSTASGTNGTYGTLGVAATNNTPGTRNLPATWVGTNGDLWLFGGSGNGSNMSGSLGDLWRYSPSTNQWAWMGGTATTGVGFSPNGIYGTQGAPAAANTPGYRFGGAAWTDKLGRFWLFGGQGYGASGASTGDLSDLWCFDPILNQWAWVRGAQSVQNNGVYGAQGVASNTNAPGARQLGTSFKPIGASSELYLFGGLGYAATGVTEQRLNDLWKLEMPKLPSATTLAATSVTGVSATLNGSANPAGAAATLRFLFGTSPSLSGAVYLGAQSAGSDTADVDLSHAVSGLNFSTTYYYRAEVFNAYGSVQGSILSFTTAPAPDISLEQPVGTVLTDGTATVNIGSALPTQSVSKTFTIRNTGTTTLSGLSAGIAGTHATNFTVSALPATLSAGASTTFNVTFSPSSVGAHSAILQIDSNDPDEAPFDVLLSGTGLTPDASLSALTLSSGSLSPSFEGAITSYTTTVSSATTSVTVRPTTLQTTSTVQVNGVNVASGANSASIPLEIGPNVITVLVTAVGGSVTTTYTVTVTRPPSADLVVTAVTPPMTSVDTDVVFEVSWTIMNQGAVATSGSWRDKVYLSTDGALGGDVLLGSFQFSAVIPSGQSATRTQPVVIPRTGTTAGSYRLIVVADADSELPEGVNEGNNWAASAASFGVTLPPLPDLTVQSISAPATILTGQTITVSWTIRNAGAGSTNTAAWSDRVYLSTDAIPDGADAWRIEALNVSYLGAGDTYTASMSAKVPIGFTPGGYFIIVKTDDAVPDGQVVEDSDANNTLTRPVTINMTPPPDLKVTNAVAPNSAYAGTSIPLNFTVMNDGTGPVPQEQGNWSEGVYLSTNNTWEPTDRLITTIARSGVLAAGSSYSRTGYSIDIPSDTASGQYYLIIEADWNKRVFEHTSGEGNNTRATGAFQVEQAPQPDLAVYDVSVPEEAEAGLSMPLTWTVTNEGAGSTGGTGWSDYVYLSSDNVLNTSTDTLLNTFGRPNTLGSGISYTRSVTVTLPDQISGTYHLFVVADGGGALPEFDPNHNAEANNTRLSDMPVEVTYLPPDLVVASVSPSTTNAQAGQQITIGWTVTNQGVGVTKRSSWNDQVYFSTDDVFNPDMDTLVGTFGNGSSLNAGQSYTKSVTTTLGACDSGTYHIFVRTDSSSQVFEQAEGLDAEGNNVIPTAPVITVTSNPADLQVTSINLPESCVAGQFMTLTWTVANAGTGPTNVSTWSDRVYLSNSPTFNAGTAVPVGTFSRSGVLAAAGGYVATQQVQVPLTFSGNYYVYVTTDSGSSVQECSAESNNQTRSTGTFNAISMPPDLQIVSDSISATPSAVNSGQSLSVSWSVINSGTGPTAATNWVDRVYLSPSTVFNLSTATQLGFVARNAALEVNGSYPVTGSFQVPRTMQGTRYVFVITDADGAVFEGSSDGNNTSYLSTPVAITLSPFPDLEIQNDGVQFTSSTPYSAGLPISVSWTVSNPGAAATGNVSWTDYAYLSRDQVLDTTDPQIGFVSRSGGLEIAGSYTQNSTFTLPTGISGTYYLIVVSDRNNALTESDELNNTAFSTAISVQTPPPADLVVNSVTPPATGVPGQPAVLTWVVQNIGSNPANGTWSDAVYLSADDVWDINDVLVDRVSRSGALAASATYTGTSTAVLPGVLPGSYRVIVRADIRNNVLEGNDGNNTGVSGGSSSTIAIDATELALGTPYPSQLATGTQHYYKVYVAADEDLRIVLDSTSTDSSNELFVRYGAVPDRGNYDFLYPSPFSPDQVITVPTTQEGWYYILVRGDIVTTPTATYTLTASLEQYGIRSISPLRAGNGGRLTLTISGGRYTSDTTAVLYRPGFPDIVAENVTRVSSTTLRARFNLNAKELGLWSLRIDSPTRGLRTFADSFTIDEAVSAPVDIRIDGPDLVKQDTRGIYTAYITNNSNNDVERVLLRLRAPASQIGVFTSAITSQYAQNVALRPDADGMMTFTAITGDIGPGETSRGLQVTLRPVTGLAEGQVPFEANARVLTYEQLDVALAAAVDDQIATAQASPALDSLVRQVVEERDWWLSTVLPAATVAIPEEIIGTHGWSSPLDLVLNLATTLGCARPQGLCPGYTALRAGTDVPETLHTAWKLPAEFGDSFPVIDGFKYITIVSALDPNEKLGSDGYGIKKFIGNQQPISYTVFFENVSTATAAAHLVTVEDTLDSSFDPNSFRVVGIQFGDVKITPPDNSFFYQGRVAMGPRFGNVLADVSVGVSRVQVGLTSQNTIKLAIRAIDPSTGEEPENPAFGVLLPNNALHDGEGSITFTLRPRNSTSVTTGSQLDNEAVITFDSNEKIRTNLVSNTLDAIPPTTKVSTLAAVQQNTSFTVSWSGEDDKDGSGRRNYDVFYSANKGPWIKWQDGVSFKSASFTNAVRGTEYRFYSLGRDNAGNVERAPLQAGTTNISPDATTVVSSGPNTAPVLAAIADRTGVVGQLLTFTATATDSDIPANTFTYSLTGTIPAGAQIVPATGVFTWTPLLGQAPGSYVINIQVADSGVPSLTASRSFTVNVRTNQAPVAGADTAGTDQGKPATITTAKLMLNDSDADGDPLTLSLNGTSSASSTNGGSVTLSAGQVTYTPVSSFHGTDTFTYTLSDGFGGTTTGTVTITVAPAFAATNNPIALTTIAGGTRRLDLIGIPGRSYRVEYSADLAIWQSLGTRTAGPDGRFSIDDPGAAGVGTRFYRLAVP